MVSVNVLVSVRHLYFCFFVFLFSNSLLQQILTCLQVKYNQYFYQYATINRLLFSLSLVFGSNLIVSHTFRYSFSTVQLVLLCEKKRLPTGHEKPCVL